jgi:hypothetical protein
VEPIAERMEALGMVWMGIWKVRARRTRSVWVVALKNSLLDFWVFLGDC